MSDAMHDVLSRTPEAPEAWTGGIPGAGQWVAYEAAASFNAMLLDMLRRRLGT